MQMNSFISQFESVLDGVEAGSITAGTDFTKLPQWDSIALLNLLAMLDGDYGVQLNGQEVRACRDVGELFRLVESRKK